MRRVNISSRWIWFLALSGGLIGCMSTRPQDLQNTYVLPAPKPGTPEYLAAEPPRLDPAVELNAIPRFLQPSARSLRPSQSDSILHEADWHFQQGRKLYQEGDQEGARKEFDLAVDVLLSAPDSRSGRSAVDAKLEELVEAIHRYDLAGLGAADTSEPAFEKPPLEGIPEMTFPIDPTIKNRVMAEVRATASQLPLQVNDAVLSFINYFSTERGRKILLFGLRRAGRYRPMIQRILDEEGVPQELIYLAQAESGFLPRAVSRVRATGMWQFMRDRGRQYGLMQTAYTDDRLDPERATRAAAKHLRDLYHRYGDWYLAVAAYNCGPGVIDRAVERTGYADFWELRRRNVLPKETTNYVPIVLAMTIMAKNAKEYGLEDVDPDPPMQYDVIDITAPTSLLLISDLTEYPVSEIRSLNPALLKDTAPAGARLRIPKGMAGRIVSALEMVPEDRRTAWRMHRVEHGETLAGIAARFHLTQNAIAAVNEKIDGIPQPGDLLLIPTPAQRTKVAAKHSTRTTRRRTAASAHGKSGSGSRVAASKKATGKKTTSTRVQAKPQSGKPVASGKARSQQGTASKRSRVSKAPEGKPRAHAPKHSGTRAG